MKKLKVGIIGCGGIANQKHLPALTSQKDKCEIVAFCDIIRERAEKAAAQYGVEGAQVCEDYHELLANPDIDAVSYTHLCLQPAKKTGQASIYGPANPGIVWNGICQKVLASVVSKLHE